MYIFKPPNPIFIPIIHQCRGMMCAKMEPWHVPVCSLAARYYAKRGLLGSVEQIDTRHLMGGYTKDNRSEYSIHHTAAKLRAYR